MKKSASERDSLAAEYEQEFRRDMEANGLDGAVANICRCLAAEVEAKAELEERLSEIAVKAGAR